MQATEGGGGGYFRAGHSFGQGRLPATPSFLCLQFVQLTLPVLQTSSARPTQCHSSPWRPRGTRCPATWRCPSCSHLPLSAPLTLLSSEKRGESEGGRLGRGQALHPGYCPVFLSMDSKWALSQEWFKRRAPEGLEVQRLGFQLCHPGHVSFPL